MSFFFQFKSTFSLKNKACTTNKAVCIVDSRVVPDQGIRRPEAVCQQVDLVVDESLADATREIVCKHFKYDI